MPELDAIEQFKKIVNTLGDEPRILEDRGETIDDVQPPEEETDSDLESLLSEASLDSETGDVGGEAPPETEEEPGDVDSLLENALEDDSSENESSSGENADEDIFGDDVFGGVDLDDLPDPTMEGLDELGELTDDLAREDSPGESGGTDDLPEGDELNLDDLDDMGDLNDMGDLGDLDGAGEGAPEAGAQEPLEEEPLEEEPSEGPDTDNLEAESPEAEAFDDDFAELPSLDDDLDSDVAPSVGAESSGAEDLDELEELGVPEDLPALDDDLEELGDPEDLGEPEVLNEPEELGEPGDGGDISDGFGDLDGLEGGDDLDDDDDFGDLDDLDTLDDFTDEDAEEFSLGDFGHEFGIAEESDDGVHGLGEIEAGLDGGSSDSGEIKSITDEEFLAIQKTLGRLPNNLKLIIEDQIGEKELSGEPLKRLLRLLIDGESPKKIAEATSEIIGKTIRIPKGYEKSTGAELERKKAGFVYIFTHSVWPKLRTFMVVGAAMWVVFLLSWAFAYRPLTANGLYQKGFNAIEDYRYTEGNDLFNQARQVWRSKGWFFRYAQEFIDQRQYRLAEEKYNQLLVYPLLSFDEKEALSADGVPVWPAYPESKRGFLEYARMESEKRANYRKAERILDVYLERVLYDYEVLLLKGDNYMRWAQEEGRYYEDARKTYAMIMNQFGAKTEVLYRMLLYFIRSDLYQGEDHYEEIMQLKRLFDSQKEDQPINPEAYAELGGYFLDRGELELVRDVLFTAKASGDQFPEVHYQLARYFRTVDDRSQEELALRKALFYLDQQEALTPLQRHSEIDSYRRMGELMRLEGQDLKAEDYLREGISIYEDALERGLVARKAEYGELYSDLGDLYYYSGQDYDTALTLYHRAEDNYYVSPEQSFHKGFIFYEQDDLYMAVQSFMPVVRRHHDNVNSLMALANTLYRRKDYFSAQAYYDHLLRELEHQMDLVEFLLPMERADHRELLENLMRTYNNLGVTYYQLSRRNQDAEKRTRALALLTEAMRVSDRITRDQETKVRTDAYDMAHLNFRSIVYPGSGTVPEIFRDIPRDMKSLYTGP